MPTRAGWLLVAGSVAIVATGRAFGAIELYVLGATGLVAVLVAVVAMTRPRPEVTVERRVVPDRVTVGGSARVELSVRAARRRVPPVALVDPVSSTVGARLVVGPVAAGEVAVAAYRLPTGRRGVLELGPLRADLGDPFGLASRRLGDGDRLRVTVLPHLAVVPPVPVAARGRSDGTGAGRRATAQTPNDDLVSLRPYVVGDDLRRVHWPSSARSDDLVVRRDEHDRPGRAALVLDVRPDAMGPEAFERAVSAAASLVQAAAEAGDAVRLATTAGDDSGLVDARRAGTELLERLAVVAQDDRRAAVPAVDGRSDAVVVLTGDRLDGPGDLGDLGEALAEVRFADGEARVPASGRVVAVGAEEPFAAVWAGWLASRSPTEVGR